MTRAKFASYSFVALVILLLLPSLALAQSSIAGVVKDASGAVVANATVQAASDVLIEGERTVTTNAEGRYAIVDLRPGTYVVTVTMSGFNTVKQTIVVPANVAVPVDAELKVGSVGETVNVEARVATVDVENASHPQTLTRTEMDALPTGRYMQSIASYIPGAHLNLPDIGGSQQIEQNYISVHGNGPTHDTYTLDGMMVNTTYLDNAIQQYIDNEAIQETTYTGNNNTAEVSGGGMFTNLIPKEGGNAYHLEFFAGGSGGTGWWQASNLDKTIGLRNCPPGSAASCTPTSGQSSTVKIEDFDGSFGGAIKKDKLWFLITGRDQVTWTQAGASKYPDGSPGIQDGGIYAGSARFTYQMNTKNKFSIFETRNWKYKNHEILDGGQEGFLPSDPATTSTLRNRWPMYYIVQGKWTGTLTPRLITEIGVTLSHLDYNDLYQPGLDEVPGTAGWYAHTTARDLGTLLRFFAPRSNQHFQTTRNLFMGAATYVTGSHTIRVGIQDSFGPYHVSVNENGDGYMQFVNGVPNSFVALNTPFYQFPNLDQDIGIFATDTWKFKRIALTYGIRFEYLSSDIQAISAPAGRFAPARTSPSVNCDTVKGMGCWKDWDPRVGIVYDVFGNHKLAVKAGFGKFNTPYATGFTNNFNPFTASGVAVPWTAVGANLPQCAPVTFNGLPAPNPGCFPTGGFNGAGALPGVGAGTLGAGPAGFGTVANSTGVGLDPNWHRDYNLQYNAGIQQEVAKGVTFNFNWYRRSQYQQTLVVNYAQTLSDWTLFNITNPLDGSPLPVYGLSATAAARAPALLQTNAPQSLVRNVYSGYEAQVTARLPRGTFALFGWTIDRDLDRSCGASAGSATSLVGNRFNDPNLLRYCDMFGSSNLIGPGGINIAGLGAVPGPAWQNEFKIQGGLPIHWGIMGSVSFYSNRYQGSFSPLGSTAGVADDGYLNRTWTINANTVYPKNCVGCTPGARVFPTGTVLGQASDTIQLVSPGSVVSPRLNQLDVSIKKSFKFKEKYVIEPEMQLFNILNNNAAVSESTSLTGDAAALLPKSACGSGSPTNCGLGGNVLTVTNPRLLRIALLFRF
ncbi:MAG: TonB-dependent receptor [Acidobacteriia bacterium]|nr:TonB-dependent receptor [Terriglobia bacterium]